MNARVMLFAWMLAMVAAGAVVAAAPQDGAPSGGPGNAPHRSLSTIRLDVHAALRAEAVSRRLGENEAEVIRLVDLYLELAAHSKRHDSDFIAELGMKLRSRLEKVRDHIERRSKNPRRRQKAVVPTLVVPESRVLAQQIAVPGGAAAGQVGQPAAGRPGAQAFDYGPELVDLIQRTISPATWDINGGNGAVVYFAPLRVLVVSAPGSVHGQLGGALGQLRAAP